MEERVQSIEKVFQKVTDRKQIHEAILLVENTKGDFSHVSEYGGKTQDSPMVMASITKMFTATCIMKLVEQKKLSLNDKLSNYLESSTLRGLHCYKGKEYSYELTIRDLLFQISGLPDVYQETKNSIQKEMIAHDVFIDFDQLITRVKKLKPHFAPGTGEKAYYADINFDLLGVIVEKVTNLPLEQVYKKYICTPLGLRNTYLPIRENEKIPKVYYKDKLLVRPKTVICSRASGGGISTARELMIFLKAFFGGKLFDGQLLNQYKQYRKLQIMMGPVNYGCGHMQIPLGGMATMFQGKGELYGHSGSTGSFAFYDPEKDLFFVGDVNQMANPAIPVMLVMQLAVKSK